ncbi:ABC transporter substrate-binding protein [Brevundimonas sp. GCM10030266]|uniref:ABC transporter substrate-binding protein n=1 Tax=Brevundimonas sp. GCM10030266 TaxID=3273386 RepID=UPI00362375AE
MRILYAGLLLCVALIGLATLHFMQPSSEALIRQANAEGELRIYGNADTDAVQPLIESFRARHPGITIHYEDINSTALNARFLSETAAGRPGADLVWSSAMDLQAKLINDGYAQSYRSPEASALPASAVWRDMGYGVTAEPVGFVYNKRLIAPDQVPRTHEALEALLRDRREALMGQVITYDPARSNLGYLQLTQDFAITRDTRSLLQAMAATRPQLSAMTNPMIDAVAEGRAAIAYNALLPYAVERAETDARIGVVLPEDYTLIVSRVAFIPRDARHPAAAKLFLDHMLSREGQALLARQWLPPVRTDLAAGGLEAERARPIRGGPQLFVNLDPVKRRRFLADWDAILAEGAAAR